MLPGSGTSTYGAHRVVSHYDYDFKYSIGSLRSGGQSGLDENFSSSRSEPLKVVLTEASPPVEQGNSGQHDDLIREARISESTVM